MIILCTFLGELYLRNWKSGVYFWVKEAWPQSGMEWILDLDKANSCVVVGCDSWASEEGEGLAWRPLAEWPWTSETWSSCVESSQVVLWADPPIRHHINTLFFRFLIHTWFSCLFRTQVWFQASSLPPQVYFIVLFSLNGGMFASSLWVPLWVLVAAVYYCN